MNKICIIGLGYVGMPLAHAFSFKYPVVGFDISQSRIDELNSGRDSTLELANSQIRESLENNIVFTSDAQDIYDSDIYIITVPTPIDKNKRPDLIPLFRASETVGKVINKGNIVIYESTVYPGATEGDCVPILEQHSGLVFNQDFYCGYSPERINPGDKEHTVTKILKVTSGSTKKVGNIVNDLYKSIITAGTHLAPSIKVAEAAKVIENAQRDVNIAFINELKMIFDTMDINTHDVIEAAKTKWNFLPFTPGMVGGHCIGVDPYYLSHKAQELGNHPEIILASRRVNDNMPIYFANQIIKKMIKSGLKVQGAKILILGVTFKENCPDIRNSKVFDLIHELTDFGCDIEITDPWADAEEVKKEFGMHLLKEFDVSKYEVIVTAVSHNEYSKHLITDGKPAIYQIKEITT